MKPLSIYILLDDGRCIFSKDFVPKPPPSQLVTGMMRAMQDFVLELTGDYITEIVSGGFRFFCEPFGPLMVVLVTSPTLEKKDINVGLKLNQIGLRFMRAYGSILDQWKGDINQFMAFEQDIYEIFGEELTVTSQAQPTKPLTGLVLMNLPSALQNTAQALVELGGGTQSEITEILQRHGHSVAKDDLSFALLELVNAGYIGYSVQNGEQHFFIS